MMSIACQTAPSARQRAWNRIADMPRPDVLILGGGVNGVGLLRDLALNGLSAVLLETGDFCGAASGASSRMAHGGLRYLEGREFRLVAEAARERNLLLHNAPHLVKPLEIVVPLTALMRGLPSAGLRFMGLSKRPGPMSLIALNAGLFLYERFGAVRKALPDHRTILRRAGFPKGISKDTRAIVSYFDGQILGPEALVMEMLDDAARTPGVAAINHVGWTAAPDGSVTVTDPLTGQAATLRPRVVVNATGSAIDRVNAALGLTTRLVRGVKGAHLVLDHPALFERMAGRAYYFDDGRGRMVICLPVGRMILMGTTEIETADPADHAVDETEIDYLLASLNRLFSDIRVGRGDLVAVTSGIRPLQAGDGNATQAARDHALIEGDWQGRLLLSLVGGKWTTFRSFAEQAADKVLAALGRTRSASTSDRDYPGATLPDAAALAAATGLSTARIAALIARYGAFATEVAQYCAAGPDMPLASVGDMSRREIGWLVHHRMALSVEDLILRRSGLVMAGQVTPQVIAEIADCMAQALDRDTPWQQAQIESASRDPRIIMNKGARA